MKSGTVTSCVAAETTSVTPLMEAGTVADTLDATVTSNEAAETITVAEAGTVASTVVPTLASFRGWHSGRHSCADAE